MPVAALTIWTRLQALVWTPLLVLGVWLGNPLSVPWRIAVSAWLLGSIVSLAWVLRAGRSIADAVTLLRALGLVVLLAIPFASPWASWLLAVLVALLDLVDGAVARRYGATSAGAVLDMETDQFTVVAFAWLVVAGGGAPHVLLLPLLRPAFVLAAWRYALPATDPKPVDGDNRRGKLVCAAVVIGLLLAMLPGASKWLRDAVTGLAVLLLLWSFSSDWQFLWQRRRAARGLHGAR